jgi:AcrR family transcriptional regulator
MARDVTSTTGTLLAVAADEFSAQGVAGTRLSTIAQHAEVSKRWIHKHIGNKEVLFDTVLLAEIDRINDAVPLMSGTPDGLIDYAGQLFDYYEKRPHLARMIYWEGLERGDNIAGEAERVERYQDKVAAVHSAMCGMRFTEAMAAHLLLSIITLVAGYHATPQLARMILSAETTSRRDAITGLVTRVIAGASSQAARSWSDGS